MICSCGNNEEQFLVDGLCSICRRSCNKTKFVVRITKEWYYDGGGTSRPRSRLPARQGLENAFKFEYRKCADKIAAKYGGEVIAIKTRS